MRRQAERDWIDVDYVMILTRNDLSDELCLRLG
jgi:hypothetical protein